MRWPLAVRGPITGATGTVGRQVVSLLLGTGAAVRALVRDPDSAGLPNSVELVHGDLSDPAHLTAALDGAATMLLVWPFTSPRGGVDVPAAHRLRQEPP